MKTQPKKKIKKKKIACKKATKSAVEKALRDTQSMLELVINNAPQHIFWKDVNSVFLGCNQIFADAVGLESPKDIVGKTDFDLTDEQIGRASCRERV